MIYKMTLKDSVDTMTFNLLETPIVDKDIEGAVDNVTLDGNQYTDYLYLKKQYIQKWAIMCPDEYDELRGFYTRQFEDGEVPSYRVYYGANVTRDYTLNGDYLQFNAEGIETAMTLSQLLGNVEQTTYSGKNLFPIPETRTLNGITLTHNADGTFNLTGTSTAITEFSVVVPLDQANITFGEQLTLGTTQTIPTVRYYIHGSTSTGAWKQTLIGWDSPSPLTKTVAQKTANFDHIKFVINISASGTTVNYTNVKLMVEKGSSATSFEPFVGGTPAPNPDYPQPISTVTGEQTVTVTGKNLWSPDNAQAFVTAVNTSSQASIMTYDGRNCLHWQSHAGYGSYPTKNLTLEVKFQENTQYTITYDLLKTGSTSRTLAIHYTDGTNTTSATAQATDTWEHYTITSTAGKTIAYIAPYYTSGDSYIDIDSVQLEKGNSASPYEPYVATNQEINLGKNLTDLSTFRIGYVNVSGAIQDAHPLGEMVSPFIKVFPNTAYTFKIVETTGTNDSWFGVGEYTSESTSSFVRRDTNAITTATSITFMTSATTNYIMVSARNLEQATKVQLEKGFQATSWAEYFPPIELAKIGNYQDRIYKDDGKWYVEKNVGKVVLDGSENISTWASQNTENTFYFATSKIDSLATSSNETRAVLCDNFTNITNLWGGDDVGVQLFTTQPSLKLRFRIANATLATVDVAGAKSWLAAHPTTVYYPLATPTTTEITNETLLLQLNFLASLYKGANNISLVGTGAQGEMEVFIRDVMSVETDVVPEVPVRLTLTDDGVINACGCRRNVQLTMRETTE